MNISLIKPISAVRLLSLSMPSGLWLSRKGKPYNSSIFTIHKLIALAAIIFIGMSIYDFQSAIWLWTSTLIGVFIFSGLMFLTLVATGALLSLDISLHRITLRIHQAALGLLYLSTAYIIYSFITSIP
jgi:hypothetical protein